MANRLKLRTPVCGAREYDSITLYVGSAEKNSQLPRPPSTEVVNAAIRLFALSFGAQPTRVQESMLEQLTSFITAPELHRDLARKAAITINVSVAILGALRATSKETSAAHGDMNAAPVAKSLRDLLQVRLRMAHPSLTDRDRCSSYTRTIKYATLRVKLLVDCATAWATRSLRMRSTS